MNHLFRYTSHSLKRVSNLPITHIRKFTTPSSSTFRPTRPTREWHQKVDHKTGKFYYVDVYTGAKTDKMPSEFLAFDAPRESPVMSMLRMDRTHQTGPTTRKSIVKQLLIFCGALGVVTALTVSGTLDRLINGPTYSELRDKELAKYDPNVVKRTEELMLKYENSTRSNSI